MDTLRLKKDDGFTINVPHPNSEEKKDDVVNDLICYKLFNTLLIDEDVTVSDLIENIRPYSDKLDIITDGFLKPILKEFDAKTSISEEECEGVITFSKYLDYIKHGQDTSIDMFTGVSLYPKEDKEDNLLPYSLLGLTLYDIRNCKMEIKKTTDVVKNKYPEISEDNELFSDEPNEDGFYEYKSNTPDDWEFEEFRDKDVAVEFTVLDIIRTLFYELSFFGLADDTKEALDEINERAGHIKKEQ